MAVYQYYLAVVPKQGIEKKHTSILNEIGVSIETGFFKSDAEMYKRRRFYLFEKSDSVRERKGMVVYG